MDKIDLTKDHDVLKAYHSVDFTEVKANYTDPGTAYCFKVLNEEIITGYAIKLACFRHLRDLQRQDTEEFPYRYSVKEVDNILKFAAICPEIKTKKPVKLMDWQKFILAMLIGWRDRLGDKRFTRAIISVARHNGKTYLMAIISIYSFLIESLGEAGQDFLVTSINYKQTSKLMGYIKQMLIDILQIEPFKSLGVEAGINMKSLASQSDTIIMPKTRNIIHAITFESGQYDSFHFKTAIGDEFADPKVSEGSGKVSKITSGQVDVSNKQFIQIATAYPDPTVPFHRDEERIIALMEADYKRQGDTYLVLDWEQDSEDEIYQPETWAKSNPLLNMPEKRERMTQDIKTERENALMSGKVFEFMNKSMNVWTQASVNSFLKLEDINRAIIPEFDIQGRTVYIGFDYSMFSDNTGIAFVYPYEVNGQPKWHIEQHSFIPWNGAGSIEAKEKQDGINYRALAEKGFCSITSHPQGLINNEQVYQWLMEYVEDNQLQVMFFGYDSWGMTTAIKQLELNSGWPLNPIRQRTSDLKDPTKFLQKIFVESSVTRLDDEILEKALINAQIIEDKIGIQVDKAKATLKIDVVDAIIDAMYQAMYHFEDFGMAKDKSRQVELMTEKQVLEWFQSDESGLQ